MFENGERDFENATTVEDQILKVSLLTNGSIQPDNDLTFRKGISKTVD